MDTNRGSQTQAGDAAGQAPRIERVATSRLPTRHGEFTLYAYRQPSDGTEHASRSGGTDRPGCGTPN